MAAIETDPNAPKIALVFYRAASGREPVREWLLALPTACRQEVGQDLMRVQWRWPVGMPLVRPMGNGLHEVRSSLPDGMIARVLFCFHDRALYALHGFIKKAQKTSRTDLDLALRRKKEVENG